MGQGGQRVGESCEGWAEKKDRGRDVGFLIFGFIIENTKENKI